MKSKQHFWQISALTVIVSAALLAGCSKSGGDGDGDKPTADTTEKAEPKPGVTVDADTQERVGLKIETPAPAEWQPQIHATGRVADPLAFTAAATDYEMARAAAFASKSELERTQKLAAQENASPRVLEAAQAAAARDDLTLTAARAKFTADWGVHLAAQASLAAYAENLQTDNVALVKLSLPTGTFPKPLPAEATIFIYGNETNTVAADFADNLGVDPVTQTQTLLFTVKQKLPPGIAVEAQIKIPGDSVSGVLVPASAVLRHEGRGWIYVQAETNRFVRAEVPLDRLMESGWFVSENLSATNRIVTSGGQTMLSAELSAGAFTTGERD